jgi:hemerythrin superfamily protein
VSSDALVLLREDHKRIRALFKDFEAAADRPGGRRERIVSRIIEELTAHTYVENEVLYPRVRALVPDLEQEILESLEEHHVADVLAGEPAVLHADDERFEAKTTVLIETVTHHITEEERDWFPKVRAALSRTQLREIGEELIGARSRAPKAPAPPSAQKAADAVLR